MPDFCECQDCGFVVQAEGPPSPTPERWDSCPGCGGSDFAFPGRTGFAFDSPEL